MQLEELREFRNQARRRPAMRKGRKRKSVRVDQSLGETGI